MLTEEKKSSLKMLVALAWADGRVDEEELEVVEAMLDAYGASKDEAEEIREWAKSARTLDDVDISALDEGHIVSLLQHAVLLTYIDGEQSAKEVELINTFVSRLGMNAEQAAPILASAEHFAKQLLPELEA